MIKFFKQANTETKEEKLVRQVLDGDTNAFGDIVDMYRGLVFSIVGKHVPLRDVDDISQEVFIRVFRSLSGWSGKGSFKSWVAGIAVRNCCDYWRSKYRRKELSDSDISDAATSQLRNVLDAESMNSYEEQLKGQASSEILEWAMNRLGPEERMLVELVYFEDMPVAEAAKLLAISSSNAKVRLFRVRKKLRNLIEEIERNK